MKAVIRVLRLLPVIITCIFALYSCSPAHTSKTQRGTEEQPVKVTEEISGVDSWKPKLASGSNRYLITDSSTISIGTDSSHSSSIHTATIYSLILAVLSDSLSLTARIESLTTDSHLQVAKPGLLTDSIEDFHATVSSNGRLSPITRELRSTCEIGVNPAATRIFELTINYPQRLLKVGDEWIDTISTTLCRGKTTLQQQNIYRYKIITFSTQNGFNTAQIQRTVSTTFSSLSTNPKNQLVTTGSGSSVSNLSIDRKTGMLIQSNEHSQITLTITTTRGSYPFTQNTLTQVELH